MMSCLVRLSPLCRAQMVRTIATSARHADASDLSPAERQEYYPKIGNRDVVGFGINGNPSYQDMVEFPAPAVRFRENSAEVLALRELELGDWTALTLEQKKELYRNSFRQTFSEMNAPSGEWKTVSAGVLIGLSIAGWLLIYIRTNVYEPLPHTITREWQVASAERMVRMRQGAVDGISSEWDYEKNTWK